MCCLSFVIALCTELFPLQQPFYYYCYHVTEKIPLICIRKAPFSVIPDICEVRPTKYDHDCVNVGVVILKKMDKWMT